MRLNSSWRCSPLAFAAPVGGRPDDYRRHRCHFRIRPVWRGRSADHHSRPRGHAPARGRGGGVARHRCSARARGALPGRGLGDHRRTRRVGDPAGGVGRGRRRCSLSAARRALGPGRPRDRASVADFAPSGGGALEPNAWCRARVASGARPQAVQPAAGGVGGRSCRYVRR